MSGHETTQGRAPSDVTLLLRKIAGGEPDAHQRLIELLYPELRKLAEFRMRGDRPDHTLQPTALVSEFFLEVARAHGISWRDRTHFLAVASQMMRRFLIDYSRNHNAQRRGGGLRAVQLLDHGFDDDLPGAAIVGQLLDRLAQEEPRMAKVVDMRCFGGLTHAEIGEVLGIDERTAKRDWQVGRAWLKAKLGKSDLRI